MTRSADVRLTAVLLAPVRVLLRLARFDIGVAAVIALLAICAVVGPVLAVDPTASPGASLGPSPVASVAATPDAAASASPAVRLGACPIPEVTPIPSGQPTPTSPDPDPGAAQPVPRRPQGQRPVQHRGLDLHAALPGHLHDLALFYSLTGDIGIAIVLVTIVIRLLLYPFFRKQIVSQRRMQMLQPEIKAIQAKYKGNRARSAKRR